MIKGTIGLGLPAVSMGLLSLVISPFQAATLLIILPWSRTLAIVRRRTCIATGTTFLAVAGGHDHWFSLECFPTLGHGEFQSEALLGGMLAIYGLYGFVCQNMPNLARMKNIYHRSWAIWAVLTVATGVVVIPVVPYLQSLHLKRDDLVQSLGLAFTVSTLCLATYLHLNPVETLPLTINCR